MVTCKVVENNIELIDLKLNVVSREQARHICNCWKNSATYIYQEIIKIFSNS